jgi:hypothetical protein
VKSDFVPPMVGPIFDRVLAIGRGQLGGGSQAPLLDMHFTACRISG